MTRALLVAFLLLPAFVSADEVFTRGGGQLTGEIVGRGPRSIVVDVGGGTIELPLSYVERIVPGLAPTAAFRQKAERLAADDASGWVALGQWARQQELDAQADEAFRHVLSQDPDNAAAHQALEHVRVADAWVTREEGYRAQGLVPFDGGWVTPDERRSALAERAAAVEQAQFEAQAVVRLRESEAHAREAEARARIAEAAARVAEVDAGRAEVAARGLQWVPIGAGLAPLTFASHRGLLLPGCNRRGGGVLIQGRGFIPVAGRGGAFVVSRDAGPVLR